MIGTTEIILILIVILLLFGAKKLPELARSIGDAIREFKKAQTETERNSKDVNKDINKHPDDN